MTNKIDRLIQQYNVSYREISCKDDTQLHLEEIFTSFIGEIMDCEYIDDCHGIKKKGADRSSFTLMDKSNLNPYIKSENCCNIV